MLHFLRHQLLIHMKLGQEYPGSIIHARGHLQKCVFCWGLTSKQWHGCLKVSGSVRLPATLGQLRGLLRSCEPKSSHDNSHDDASHLSKHKISSVEWYYGIGAGWARTCDPKGTFARMQGAFGKSRYDKSHRSALNKLSHFALI